MKFTRSTSAKKYHIALSKTSTSLTSKLIISRFSNSLDSYKYLSRHPSNITNKLDIHCSSMLKLRPQVWYHTGSLCVSHLGDPRELVVGCGISEETAQTQDGVTKVTRAQIFVFVSRSDPCSSSFLRYAAPIPTSPNDDFDGGRMHKVSSCMHREP